MKTINEYNKSINESSMSRIWKHISNSDAAIITAFRGSNVNCVHDTEKGKVFSKDENMDRNKQLGATLLKLKYSITSLDGIYIEGYGTDSAKKENENSFLVINRKNDKDFTNNIQKLGELYCQDSVLIIKDGGDNAYLLGTNHSYPGLGKEEFQGRFVPKGEGQFMSTKRNASFVFDKSPKPNPNKKGYVKESNSDNQKIYVINDNFENYEDLMRMGKWAVTSMSESVIEYLYK